MRDAPSTIYRELKRNHFEDDELPYLSGYYGVNAHKYANDRRARKRKLMVQYLLNHSRFRKQTSKR